MRFPNLGVVASLLVAIGCARGEDIVGGHVALIDAGLTEPPGETGGGPDQGSGGVVGAGGDTGMGDVPQSSGGSTQGSGGTTSTSGGKTSTAGTTGSGGKSSNGGTTSGMGGTTSNGGKASGGASSGGTSNGGSTSGGGNGGACPSGQKSCNGLCTPPAPRVGCGTTGCDACTLTAPQNGYVTCANNQCVFDCLSGYTKSGDKCIGTGAGGSTGTGSCTPASCPQNCSVVFGPACCTTDGKCGCPLVPWVTPTCTATK